MSYYRQQFRKNPSILTAMAYLKVAQRTGSHNELILATAEVCDFLAKLEG